MKITFTAKHTDGAKYMGFENVQYLGKSRIDGFPMFSYTKPIDKKINLSDVWSLFVFNGRPGYTPESSDFEIIPSLEEPFEPKKGIVERYSGKSTTSVDDIIPVYPLSVKDIISVYSLKAPDPMGLLFYFDYVYQMEIDNRLLLML